MKNKDTEKIYNDVKRKISISNFIEEENEVMVKNKHSIFKSIAVACCMLLSITGVVFAKDIGNFINNFFGYNASDGVQTAVENGYIKEVESEYIESDGIEISVDSFLIDDYNLDINFKMKLSNKYDSKIMKGADLQDLKILDENGNIVFATMEVTQEKAKKDGTLGTENFNPLFWGGYSMGGNIIEENELIYHLVAYGSEEHKIQKAKELNISFSKIFIKKDNNEKIINTTYTGEWKFKVDVPEDMYNRENLVYKYKSCNDKNISVGYAILSNTAFKIEIPEITTDKINYEILHSDSPKSIFDKMALQKEYVETSDGKRFEPAMRSDGDGGYSLPASESNKIINYSQTFNLTKFDATDELKVHIFTNKGEEIIIEYERSKEHTKD